jgi:hypothetical protein
MKRREFLATLGGGILGSALPRPAILGAPATLDLRIPLRLAVACIINRMDPDAQYRPWFAVDVENWTPTHLRHDVWDFGDMSGRFLEALSLAQNMIEPTENMLQAKSRIRKYVVGLLGPSGLVMNPELNRPDHMFSQGSALYGLVADFEDGRDPSIKQHIEALIAGLDEHAKQAPDYLWFPDVATPISPCAHMAAYQVFPVVRFYELTGYPKALKYAERLSRWAFYVDKTVTADGVITKTGWEGHLHAWMDTYSGIICCARAGGNLNLQEVVARSRKLFDWVKLNETTPYGWVADSVGSTTCETCTISSAIRLALELIKEGHTEYWNDIERFVRNQLIQNQFRNVDQLGIKDPLTSRGLKGAFESYAAPNTLIATKDGTIEGCCINGGIRSLSFAYQNAIVESEKEIRVNLLISHATKGVEVVSYFPNQGRLEIYPRCSKNLWVRCPDWRRQEDVITECSAGVRCIAESETHSLRITGARPGARVVLWLAQREETTSSVVAGKKYEVTWRGDTVMRLTPHGAPFPTYKRNAGIRHGVTLTAGDGPPPK